MEVFAISQLSPETQADLSERLYRSGIAPGGVCQRACSDVRFRFVPVVPTTVPELVAGLVVNLSSSYAALTIGPTVFVSRNYETLSGLPDWLIAHEAAHVVQYYRDGMLWFLLRYMGQYFYRRLTGRTSSRAYRENHYEQMARTIEQAIRQRPLDGAGVMNDWLCFET